MVDHSRPSRQNQHQLGHGQRGLALPLYPSPSQPSDQSSSSQPATSSRGGIRRGGIGGEGRLIMPTVFVSQRSGLLCRRLMLPVMLLAVASLSFVLIPLLPSSSFTSSSLGFFTSPPLTEKISQRSSTVLDFSTVPSIVNQQQNPIVKRQDPIINQPQNAIELDPRTSFWQSRSLFHAVEDGTKIHGVFMAHVNASFVYDLTRIDDDRKHGNIQFSRVDKCPGMKLMPCSIRKYNQGKCQYCVGSQCTLGFLYMASSMLPGHFNVQQVG